MSINNKQIVKAMFWAEDAINLNATELGDMFKTFLDNNNVAFEVCNPEKDKRVGVQELVEENTKLKKSVKDWQELYLKSIKQKI
jgi:hypothetical protein